MTQGLSDLSESSEQVVKTGPADAGRLGPLLAERAILHHLGFVVASISAVADEFALFTSASWDRQIIYDPVQEVRASFFIAVDGRNPVFELVEPAGEASQVSNFLRKNRGGLHHVCYEVDNLESALQEARRVGLVIVSAPAPAVAFGGRRIAWVCSQNRLLMEFLERGPKLADAQTLRS